jgi:hypothetical protein
MISVRLRALNGSESGGGLLARQVLRLFRTRISRALPRRGKERKTINPSIQLKTTSLPLLILLLLVCFAFLPRAQAVIPPPDGGYPNFNTAEGQNALFSLTTGAANTAVGWFSLQSNTDGSFNTGVGAGTLILNVGNPKYA